MDATNRIRHRQWAELPYRDAREDLVNLGRLQGTMERAGNSPTLSDLRNHELKAHVENRQAALFAHFAGELIIRAPVGYAMFEDEDYDCIFRWREQERNCYQAVQLKVIVPRRLNPKAEINREFAKLSKYKASSKTIAAFHINQTGLLDFSNLENPDTSICEIWLYGALSATQSQWFLYGNVLKNPALHEINYPA